MATDFAVRALGLPHPLVVEPPTLTADGVGIVYIHLPAVDRDLAVGVQRQLDENWVIIDVGDQRHPEGITLLPDGKPEPVITIHPPVTAAAAELTEVAADGIHRVHLTADDLRTGVAHLPALRRTPSALEGEPIHSILIVYRDNARQAVDAMGAEYG